MNKILIVFLILIFSSSAFAQTENSKDKIYLLVRADDIASFHEANLACIRSVKEGIAKSIEIMVPCAWFPEAVKMLNENPSIDVGIHLVLTSEWDEVKWRPLTHAPSLTDANGYFFPMIWGDVNNRNCLKNNAWKLDEIENELRAQIELAQKCIPGISHISAHMGFTGMDSKVSGLVDRLGEEYHLKTEKDFELKRMEGWGKVQSTEEAIVKFIENIGKLTPGTYLFVEHPGINGPEMQAISKSNIAEARQRVTDVFTSKEVKQILLKKRVKLVSYADLSVNQIIQ